MHIFVSYILVFISPLAYGDENEDQRILSLVLGKIKSQFEDKVDYQVKYEHLVRELEQKFRMRELEFDNRIRELEQNIRIRELKQDDRIRKLEQTMQKKNEDMKRDCTCGKKDYTNVEVNHELVLSNNNATIRKTPDMIVKDPVPNELKHDHNRRYKKNEKLERLAEREQDFF
ncbi:unnamed protein product [Mytilus edulis]|uniref:Secreted protein n=1 Tax=Mytilus edulis TaxID=6550 RepID=A0A8S3VAC5_MYTED|nr:unnamed protein product [Mytilus edulis]